MSTPNQDTLIRMTTPKGDKPRAMNRRLLKLRGGAFGKLDEVEQDQMKMSTRHKHGNDTHGTKRGN